MWIVKVWLPDAVHVYISDMIDRADAIRTVKARFRKRWVGPMSRLAKMRVTATPYKEGDQFVISVPKRRRVV